MGMVPLKANKNTVFVELHVIFACQISTKTFLNLLLYKVATNQNFLQSILCGKVGTASLGGNKGSVFLC